MPLFQLQVAIALAGIATTSVAALYLVKDKQGKIQLPENTEEPDPFDVAQPDDFVDGFPIDGDVFWAQMRTRKLLLTALLAGILIANAVGLGLSCTERISSNVLVYSIYTVYTFYILVLALTSVNQTDTDAHSKSILHITYLSTCAAVLLAISAILPRDALPVRISSSTSTSSTPIDALWYTALALYTLTSVLAGITPLGPPLHFPAHAIYTDKTARAATNPDPANVTGQIYDSALDKLTFAHTTKVVMQSNAAATTFELADLPIIPVTLRATLNYGKMRGAISTIHLRVRSWSGSHSPSPHSWTPKSGSGWTLGYRLLRLNAGQFVVMFWLALVSAALFYAPPIFLQRVIAYLEADPERRDRSWGWVYVVGLFGTSVGLYITSCQLYAISMCSLQARMRVQLNTSLFAKTLVRKDISSISASSPATKVPDADDNAHTEANTDADASAGSGAGADAKAKPEGADDASSSKTQVMTLMTTDVDTLSSFSGQIGALIAAPTEITVGSIFLYQLLGVSAFVGLGVTCIFLPLNHYAGRILMHSQNKIMEARDERISLMNEILGAIRMLKFMAWEHNFEAKVLKIREKELKYQKINFTLETFATAFWKAAPIVATVVAFWHFAVIRGQDLTPSIAFSSIIVFTELKYALGVVPETLINLVRCMVSMRRIEKYLDGSEVDPVPPLDKQSRIIAFQSCTVTWPQARSIASNPSSVASTPHYKFSLVDLTLHFPTGELSLVCGKLGSGKTLLLLALLGEAELLSGQVSCPHSPPNSIASFVEIPTGEAWVVDGVCAYVPQSAWLQNASVRENILFNLPYDEERYRKTLQACALVTDLDILEDGDESEIGERGVNLSGGQKARVSLARAVYSRASIILLDDVLAAVDAHTAHHIYHECIRGELMRNRTIILVSHHVQLAASEAKYVVALDNGRVQYEGDGASFQSSPVLRDLVQSSGDVELDDTADEGGVPEAQAEIDDRDEVSESGNTTEKLTTAVLEKKPARKLVEDETRALGRVGWSIWTSYFLAWGTSFYWGLFVTVVVLAALSPIIENGWLKVWSQTVLDNETSKGPVYYISIYATVTAVGLVVTTLRWLVLYTGSIRASDVLYQRLLETVLFADIRFHDTVSRGRVLNRFGKDFEGIDSTLATGFGHSTAYGASALTNLITISFIGGLPFILLASALGILFYKIAGVYGQISRDIRRLDSVNRSPLYSIYGETISGVTILRAFGASSRFLRDMFRCVDANTNTFYWMWGVNIWLSIRFRLLSTVILGATAIMAVLNPKIDASLAGFALVFANSIINDSYFMVRHFVGLEQSMVALERVKEYSDLKREPAEFVEPRPPPAWPSAGAIKCENLAIRYAPDLPNVLHNVNFEIQPGEKIGILGRTGSGKSTLALSFFRFVEATEGRIVVDGLDLANIGLADLRSRMTIIPQDPTILSGTLRTTLDVFDEYQDAEIFEALRRVQLIPSEDSSDGQIEVTNENVFRNLDSQVSEGGDNFSTGQKQLLCMARAILKRSKILVMDEATASVDYSTDELISKTIRQKFAGSTILTIAHRLRTVIDYDRVMVLDQGHIVEFDRPSVLLADSTTKFHALCKATGKAEFSTLNKLAQV